MLPKAQCYLRIRIGAMNCTGKNGKITLLDLEFLVFVAM